MASGRLAFVRQNNGNHLFFSAFLPVLSGSFGKGLSMPDLVKIPLRNSAAGSSFKRHRRSPNGHRTCVVYKIRNRILTSDRCLGAGHDG